MKKVFFTTLSVFLILLGLAQGFYILINSEVFQVAGEIVPRVQTDSKKIALTFDDGPNERTDEILKVLQEKNVSATFYVIGENIEKFPTETQKIVAAGHELGNHSYTHQRMVFKPASFVADEVDKTNDLIRQASFSGEITFRPPYGKKFITLPQHLASNNQKTITWDVEPTKALGSTASNYEITRYVVEHTRGGSIILIHPWYGDQNNSREAIPNIIENLKSRGFEFVTVGELLKENHRSK